MDHRSSRPQSRRGVLKRAVAASAALGIGGITRPSWLSRPTFAAPSTRLRVGVIGVGVRGKYLIGNLPESAQVVSLCDCATSRIGSAMEPQGEFRDVLARFRDQDASHCTTHQDYRRMLDREQLDAVIIATPDHHHTLAAMTALQAGLDVYLEKPLTVSIREGRLLADMVAKTGRVLQVGSQQRTMEMNCFGCEFVRSGGLGKIKYVELPNYPGPMADPGYAGEPAPKGLDWNLFLGPTPFRPHHRQLWVKDDFKVGNMLWRGWDLFRDFSGHIMTNWGAHSVDMVQYALGRDDTGPVEVRVIEPKSIEAIGEAWKAKSPLPKNEGERRFWPVSMKYDDGVELRFVHDIDFIRFHGERGTMKMRRNHFECDPVELVSDGPDPEVLKKWSGSGHVARPHLQNWLDCVRGEGDLHAPVEVGHRTITVCHLANLARELGVPLRWDPVRERFVGNDDANQRLDRPRRKGFELPV